MTYTTGKFPEVGVLELLAFTPLLVAYPVMQVFRSLAL